MTEPGLAIEVRRPLIILANGGPGSAAAATGNPAIPATHARGRRNVRARGQPKSPHSRLT